MSFDTHPANNEPCPECGETEFTQDYKVKQVGMIYECDTCGAKLAVYDDSEHGMGNSLTWQAAQPVIESLGHQRKCNDCGYKWHYGGTSDRPTCPDCKGKNTVPV